MTGEPRVSILMPVFNPDPRLLSEAIGSVLAQTLKDWELIIVEDPAPTLGRETVAGFADSRIQYHLNTKRTSLCKQRNLTLELARAEYVAMLDADDVALPERLEVQARFLDEHAEIGVVGTWLEAIDLKGKTIGYRNYPVGHEEIAVAMRQFNPVAQPSVMARRSAILAVGGYKYDEYPIAEDYDLWCRLVQAGVRFANLPEWYLRYRVHPASSKTAKLHATIRATRDVKIKHWGHVMTFWDRLRLLGEAALLCLPASWVLQVFTLLTYGSRDAGLANPSRNASRFLTRASAR